MNKGDTLIQNNETQFNCLIVHNYQLGMLTNDTDRLPLVKMAPKRVKHHHHHHPCKQTNGI